MYSMCHSLSTNSDSSLYPLATRLSHTINTRNISKANKHEANPAQFVRAGAFYNICLRSLPIDECYIKALIKSFTYDIPRAQWALCAPACTPKRTLAEPDTVQNWMESVYQVITASSILAPDNG